MSPSTAEGFNVEGNKRFTSHKVSPHGNTDAVVVSYFSARVIWSLREFHDARGESVVTKTLIGSVNSSVWLLGKKVTTTLTCPSEIVVELFLEES